MQLQFPAKITGKPESIKLAAGRCMLIVGANGAGKTRFTAAVADTLGDTAYPLSALQALYTKVSTPESLSAALRKRFSPNVIGGLDKTPATVLDLLMSQLMHDEMVNLIGYKLALADHKDAHLRHTRLDSVVALWQDVFPGNRVLVDSGKMLFSRGIDASQYSAVRLSDGERAVLYYAAAVLYAPKGGVIFVDSPEIFLHPSLTTALWNRLEALRSDCIFCYTTHDPEFASSRNGAPVVWVRDCDPVRQAWDYNLLPPNQALDHELYMTLVGARKPVLFIEGDSERSIDAKLYPLIFPDFTVRSLGSCNKVIEATRTFNDLAAMHKLDSFGIVDRDRRDEGEVAYLRRKKIMVPEVAEIENLLLIEEIVLAMVENAGKDAQHVLSKVKHTIISLFRGDLRQQALQHTRHKVKRTVEYRVDAKFSDIGTLEKHLECLLDQINPRSIYEQFCKDFHGYADTCDYAAILKVFNQKSMLASSNVAQLCGFNNKEEYIAGVIALLHKNTKAAKGIRAAVRRTLGYNTDN